MFFNIEPAICQTRKELCPHQFVMRGYADENQSRNFGVSTVIERGNGLWEITGFVTTNHAPAGYYEAGLNYLISKGYSLSASIEKHRLSAYERKLKGKFELRKIKEGTKQYNGQKLYFWYVEFIDKEKP